MRVNTKHVNSTRSTSTNDQRMYFWWSVCTLYLHASDVWVTVGDSGFCCYVWVLINSLVCWFCTSALGFILLQIVIMTESEHPEVALCGVTSCTLLQTAAFARKRGTETPLPMTSRWLYVVVLQRFPAEHCISLPTWAASLSQHADTSKNTKAAFKRCCALHAYVGDYPEPWHAPDLA